MNPMSRSARRVGERRLARTSITVTAASVTLSVSSTFI